MDVYGLGNNMKQDEKRFETSFSEAAHYFGCRYYKVPDPIIKTGDKVVEHKRPFDGVLVTPHSIICVELKIAGGKLKTHQKENLGVINGIHKGGMIILRKFVSITGNKNNAKVTSWYRVDGVDCKFNSLEELFLRYLCKKSNT